MIIINFKNYSQALGEEGIVLAENLEDAARDFPDVLLTLAVPAPSIAAISKAVEIPVYSQHIDPFDPGQTTGFVIAEAVKGAGASGTLISHSERPMAKEMIVDAERRARNLGLKTVVCTSSIKELVELKAIFGELEPDFFAYEPPELIGGRVSVTEAEPAVIVDAVQKSSPTPLLCGAGVNSRSDVERALELGTEGVLVASDVVTAVEPANELRDLLEGF